MARSLIVLVALGALLRTSNAAADEHSRRTALLSMEAVYDRAPTLALVSSTSCGFFCSTDRYLGLNQAGTALRLEYRERRTRRAGVRLTGRLGWSHGWWVNTLFEGGFFSAGERDGQHAVASSSIVTSGLAFGPIFFVRRTTISPALGWDGAYRTGAPSFVEDEETSYPIPRSVHALGVEIAVDHAIGARTRLLGAFRIGGVTGTGDPFDLGYRVSLGVTVDLRPPG